MFSDTIFDNTKEVIQKSPFQYVSILAPLNLQTDVTIAIYEKINKILSNASSLRDIDLE